MILLTNLALALAASSSPALLLHVDGLDPAGRFGVALAGVGDLDGDGRGDFAVGAPMARAGGEPRGRVTLVSGADGASLWSLAGPQSFGRFGAALAGGRDLDGDGVADVVIGAPFTSPHGGSVTAVSGASGARLFTLSGEAAGDGFGAALALVDDADGDGRPDLCIGAPHNDSGGFNAGRVYLVSGATHLVLRTWDGAAFDALGTSVAGAGDVDGDGLTDLWLGAPFADGGGFNAGSTRAVSGATGATLFEVHGAAAGDQLGFRVARAGDVDGDGTRDLLACAPASDLGGLDAGAVRVVSGASGALLLDHAWHVAGRFAAAAVGLDDLDGDGRGEVALGASAEVGAGGAQAGAVRGFGSNAPLFRMSGLGARDWFGATLVRIGDVNADGHEDFAVGAPGHDDDATQVGYVRVFSGAPFGP